MKRFLAFFAGGVILVLAALGWYLWIPGTVPSGQAPLVFLSSNNFHQLQTEFNEAPGNVRIVLLLSPT
jgi:hypothetical protein